MTTCISYIRVSTQKQGDSGLGLEAQQQAVDYFVNCNGWKLIDTFTEVESGRKDDRPQMANALRRCRETGSTLIVAKLDRLARDVGFLHTLMKSQVKFLACDQPHANKLTLTILMAVAEDEADRISQRTVAALAARRARGLPLGAQNPNSRNLDDDARKKGAKKSGEAKSFKAWEHYHTLMPTIEAMEDLTLAETAAKLNADGIKTFTGKPWSEQLVHRIIKKYGD